MCTYLFWSVGRNRRCLNCFRFHSIYVAKANNFHLFFFLEKLTDRRWFRFPNLHIHISYGIYTHSRRLQFHFRLMERLSSPLVYCFFLLFIVSQMAGYIVRLIIVISLVSYAGNARKKKKSWDDREKDNRIIALIERV